jgi:hypothetical protein
VRSARARAVGCCGRWEGREQSRQQCSMEAKADMIPQACQARYHNQNFEVVYLIQEMSGSVLLVVGEKRAMAALRGRLHGRLSKPAPDQSLMILLINRTTWLGLLNRARPLQTARVTRCRARSFRPITATSRCPPKQVVWGPGCLIDGGAQGAVAVQCCKPVGLPRSCNATPELAAELRLEIEARHNTAPVPRTGQQRPPHGS